MANGSSYLHWASSPALPPTRLRSRSPHNSPTRLCSWHSIERSATSDKYVFRVSLLSLLLPRGRRGPGRGGCIVKRGSVYPLPNPPPARPSQGEGDIRRNAEHILRRGRRHERMSGSKPCV